MHAWLERTGRPIGAVLSFERTWALAQRWYAGRAEPGWRGRSAVEAQVILDAMGLTGDFWRLT